MKNLTKLSLSIKTNDSQSDSLKMDIVPLEHLEEVGRAEKYTSLHSRYIYYILYISFSA